MKQSVPHTLFALLALSTLIGCGGRGLSEAEREKLSSSYSEPKPQVDQDAIDRAKVKVKDDVDIKIEDDYTYVRGSVINKSSRSVGYWKVTVNFMKKGKIVDSAFTNALETLLPGASKRFEIMHNNIPGLDDMRCYVEEVTFKCFPRCLSETFLHLSEIHRMIDDYASIVHRHVHRIARSRHAPASLHGTLAAVLHYAGGEVTREIPPPSMGFCIVARAIEAKGSQEPGQEVATTEQGAHQSSGQGRGKHLGNHLLKGIEERLEEVYA
jgi:hypothetical protein